MVSATWSALTLDTWSAPILTVPDAFRVLRAERSNGCSGGVPPPGELPPGAGGVPPGAGGLVFGGRYRSTLSRSAVTSKAMAGCDQCDTDSRVWMFDSSSLA